MEAKLFTGSFSCLPICAATKGSKSCRCSELRAPALTRCSAKENSFASTQACIPATNCSRLMKSICSARIPNSRFLSAIACIIRLRRRNWKIGSYSTYGHLEYLPRDFRASPREQRASRISSICPALPRRNCLARSAGGGGRQGVLDGFGPLGSVLWGDEGVDGARRLWRLGHGRVRILRGWRGETYAVIPAKRRGFAHPQPRADLFTR